jgi:hypothetical protein
MTTISMSRIQVLQGYYILLLLNEFFLLYLLFKNKMSAHVCCNRDTFQFHLLTQLVFNGTILRETESGRDQTV